MRTVAEMRDSIDGYDGRGDTGRKQKRCGTIKMAKWVERTVMDWVNINRE